MLLGQAVMNVPQGVQCPSVVRFLEPAAVVAFLPLELS